MKNLKFLFGFALFGLLVFTSCEKEPLLENQANILSQVEPNTLVDNGIEIEVGKDYKIEELKGTSIAEIIKEDITSQQSGTHYYFGAKRTMGSGCFTIKAYPFSNSGLLYNCNNNLVWQKISSSSSQPSCSRKSAGKVSIETLVGDPNNAHSFLSGNAYILKSTNNGANVNIIKSLAVNKLTKGCQTSETFRYKKCGLFYYMTKGYTVSSPCY